MTNAKLVATVATAVLISADCSSPISDTHGTRASSTCSNKAACDSVATCDGGRCESQRSDVDAGLIPCDPLAPKQIPITLNSVVGVGKSADGTLYAADESGTLYRVFASEGDSLQRKRVIGVGRQSTRYLLDFEVGDDPYNTRVLVIEGPDAMPTGMWLGGGNPKEPVLQEQLTVVDASALDGLPLRNMPDAGAMLLTAVFDVDDGSLIVVTNSKYDDGGSYGVYYGRAPRMVQRRAYDFLAPASGGAPNFKFDYDGAVADLAKTGDGLRLPDGQEHTVSLRDPTPMTLDGLSFFCFQ